MFYHRLPLDGVIIARTVRVVSSPIVFLQLIVFGVGRVVTVDISLRYSPVPMIDSEHAIIELIGILITTVIANAIISWRSVIAEPLSNVNAAIAAAARAWSELSRHCYSFREAQQKILSIVHSVMF